MKLETQIIGPEGERVWLARVGSFTSTASKKVDAVESLRHRLRKALQVVNATKAGK